MRVSVSSRAFATQMRPAPTATPAGVSPTPIGLAPDSLRGSSRVTVPWLRLATHAMPASAAIAVGLSWTGISRPTMPTRGSGGGSEPPPTKRATTIADAATTPANATAIRPRRFAAGDRPSAAVVAAYGPVAARKRASRDGSLGVAAVCA